MEAVAGRIPASTPGSERVSTARWGVVAYFWVIGALSATFLSRIPAIADLLHVTTGQLAQLLLFGAVGALSALLVTGWSVARFGTRSLLGWSGWLYLAAIVALAWSTTAGNLVVFAVGIYVMSFSLAFTNVCMNAEAANVERWLGRPMMPQFHAAFSIGLAMGIGLGALVSYLGVAPAWHLLAATILLTVARVALTPMMVVDGRPVPGAAPGGVGGPFKTAREEYSDRRVVLIGLVVFAASTIEGAAAQWSSLAVVTAFDQPESVGALMYWAFVVAMVTTRALGSRIIGRWGRVKALRASAALVAVGVATFAFSPVLWLVPVAMAAWGLGAGLGTPIGFSAAADHSGRAAARVAAVTSFATVSGLVMPQIIGQLGDIVELRQALLVAAVAAAMLYALARAVRKDGAMFRSRARLARSAALAAPPIASAGVFAVGADAAEAMVIVDAEAEAPASATERPIPWGHDGPVLAHDIAGGWPRGELCRDGD